MVTQRMLDMFKDKKAISETKKCSCKIKKLVDKVDKQGIIETCVIEPEACLINNIKKAVKNKKKGVK